MAERIPKRKTKTHRVKIETKNKRRKQTNKQQNTALMNLQQTIGSVSLWSQR